MKNAVFWDVTQRHTPEYGKFLQILVGKSEGRTSVSRPKGKWDTIL
jgi:hypothetical protein